MKEIILLLSFILFVVLLAGLIRPNWVFKSGEFTRKRVLKVYGLGYLAFSVVAELIMPSTENTPADTVVKKDVQQKEFSSSGLTLAEYRQEEKDSRRDVVAEFIAYKGLPESFVGGFYRCLSQTVYTKDNNLTVGKALGWCYMDYSDDPLSLDNWVDFDYFDKQFSGWNGSHYALEKLIKSGMDDKNSYEHIKTDYRLVLNKNPRAIVSTTFFNNKVKQTVNAEIDIETGDILKIIQ